LSCSVLVLLRAFSPVVRQIFRWLLRPLRLGVRYVFGRIAAALRFMRILSKSQPQRPADAVSGTDLSQALTETDNAIKEGFDPASIPTERHRRVCVLGCTRRATQRRL
jgi:hypothetical protein